MPQTSIWFNAKESLGKVIQLPKCGYAHKSHNDTSIIFLCQSMEAGQKDYSCFWTLALEKLLNFGIRENFWEYHGELRKQMNPLLFNPTCLDTAFSLSSSYENTIKISHLLNVLATSSITQ